MEIQLDIDIVQFYQLPISTLPPLHALEPGVPLLRAVRGESDIGCSDNENEEDDLHEEPAPAAALGLGRLVCLAGAVAHTRARAVGVRGVEILGLELDDVVII